MEELGHRITSVSPGSIGEEMEIVPGDRLLSVDGHPIRDVLDYRYYINAESVVILIRKEDGQEWELEIANDYEDIGLEFDQGLMSEYRSCTNNCMFCFIDQMPPGMRETLYFKDDDSRLSFLQGNYVTLTNMSDAEIDRIIRFRLAPINISVHTTNPVLRRRMLHNARAGSSLGYIKKLYDNGIPMNAQIVLCRGVNDGKELIRTIEDLLPYVPVMESLSVVPVGLTKFRDGLAPLLPIDKKTARETIDTVEFYQREAMQKHGIHFVQASDELYLTAQRPLPEADRYDGYIQLENGVGMLRLLQEETGAALRKKKRKKGSPPFNGLRRISIATGLLAYPVISRLAKKIQKAFPLLEVYVYPIRNEYFGEAITVAGLITGNDLKTQLARVPLGERLLLTIHMFRSGEEVFLDDMTRGDLEKELGVEICIVGGSGEDFVEALVNPFYAMKETLSGYEPQKKEWADE